MSVQRKILDDFVNWLDSNQYRVFLAGERPRRVYTWDEIMEMYRTYKAREGQTQ